MELISVVRQPYLQVYFYIRFPKRVSIHVSRDMRLCVYFPLIQTYSSSFVVTATIPTVTTTSTMAATPASI